MSKGSLYIVATPIGNLGDFSTRAAEVLRNVDIIACEDTRVTQKLLNHFDIKTKTVSYHKFSEKERSGKLIEMLSGGQNVALVSDAGTPIISDPGGILVENARKEGIKVIPIPGCCAAITALSAIHNDGTFAFLGFFPQKLSDAKNVLEYAKNFNLVFYESPNRILKTLDFIKENLGCVDISVARELTKIHEDINTFEISEMINYLKNSVVKGEIVFVVHKKEAKENFDYIPKAQKLLAEGFSAKDAAKIISTIYDVPKNDVYKKLLDK
ncbi:MAG: 16S rRNA (cytidine(1402)-2'-O)-methyltransferase [bacterium]|nr:16S rRNA (cytidine(1402)-2'-O)-methyltransferase [bacterium]